MLLVRQGECLLHAVQLSSPFQSLPAAAQDAKRALEQYDAKGQRIGHGVDRSTLQRLAARMEELGKVKNASVHSVSQNTMQEAGILVSSTGLGADECCITA